MSAGREEFGAGGVKSMRSVPRRRSACLAGAAHVRRPRVGAGERTAGIIVVGDAELRRDHHPITPVGDGAAEDPLAVPGAIGVGGVEERDAEVESSMDGTDRFVVVHVAPIGAADRPTTEPERGDLDSRPAQRPHAHAHVGRP